jgi:5-hydroxyisourate hydrolase
MHAIDTFSGATAAGLKADLSIREGDGRTDEMILKPEATKVGRYELVFHVDEYFAKQGTKLPSPAFIEQVPVRFSVFDAKQHYHVPMLCTPWSCTTYRGS